MSVVDVGICLADEEAELLLWPGATAPWWLAELVGGGEDLDWLMAYRSDLESRGYVEGLWTPLYDPDGDDTYVCPSGWTVVALRHA